MYRAFVVLLTRFTHTVDPYGFLSIAPRCRTISLYKDSHRKAQRREKNEKYRWECKERRRQKWIREEEIKWNEIALKESKKSSSMSTKVMRAKKFEKKQAIMAGTRESERTNHALPRDNTAFPSGKRRDELLISSLGWSTMRKITQEQRGGSFTPLSLLLLWSPSLPLRDHDSARAHYPLLHLRSVRDFGSTLF